MQELGRDSRLPRHPQFSMLDRMTGGKRSIDSRRDVASPQSIKKDSNGQSLPMSIGRSNRCLAPGQKRKRIVVEEDLQRDTQKNHTSHEKRFSVVGPNSTSPKRDQVKQSSPLTCRKGGLRSESRILDQSKYSIRNVISTGRTDTTRTDYFRLKALGIDPDTPAKPCVNQIQKRTATRTSSEERSLISLRSHREDTPKKATHAHSLPSAPEKSKSKVEGDSDEELFAQMRQVKDAMAESISWFQEERGNRDIDVRRSLDGYVRYRIPTQIHLEKIKPTSSRTMERIRANGAKGLWPPQSKAMMGSNREMPSSRGHAILSTKSSQLHPRANGERSVLNRPPSADHASTVISSHNTVDPSHTLEHYDEYVPHDGHRQFRQLRNLENRSQYSELGLKEAADDAAYEKDLPNGTKFQYSESDDDNDDQGFLGGSVSTGEDQEHSEDLGDEWDEDDEDRVGNEDDYTEDGQDQGIQGAIREPNGHLKGATIEDAIEL